MDGSLAPACLPSSGIVSADGVASFVRSCFLSSNLKKYVRVKVSFPPNTFPD